MVSPVKNCQFIVIDRGLVVHLLANHCSLEKLWKAICFISPDVMIIPMTLLIVQFGRGKYNLWRRVGGHWKSTLRTFDYIW